ncbi:XAC2610-related protein [Zestomonas carbonaria]|uniref:VCBS repeat-containing protein n=1 Tax=Zestomonas carbonaria TaxID=2762745 RepID=A0A7U7ET55_9GAMM|nr:hypothetical protein [Pseudomonas carbonaria]CAD5110596.1 hypothetical protein PSEWESI4_04919 [Pseudomonas carbonaria]
MDSLCDQETCESSGQIAVAKKGQATAYQLIDLSNIFITIEDNKVLINSAKLYDYQGVINVGDFNFDGLEDFAVQNGNNGSYGGPSYDIFLYNKKKGNFSTVLRYLASLNKPWASLRLPQTVNES